MYGVSPKIIKVCSTHCFTSRWFNVQDWPWCSVCMGYCFLTLFYLVNHGVSCYLPWIWYGYDILMSCIIVVCVHKVHVSLYDRWYCKRRQTGDEGEPNHLPRWEKTPKSKYLQLPPVSPYDISKRWRNRTKVITKQPLNINHRQTARQLHQNTQQMNTETIITPPHQNISIIAVSQLLPHLLRNRSNLPTMVEVSQITTTSPVTTTIINSLNSSHSVSVSDFSELSIPKFNFSFIS